MFTYDDVAEVLETFADSDKSNPGCVYTSTDGQHCIAGQVLKNLGVLEQLNLVDGDLEVQQKPISMIPGIYEVFEMDAVDLLRRAQQWADGVDDVIALDASTLEVERKYMPWSEVINKLNLEGGF